MQAYKRIGLKSKIFSLALSIYYILYTYKKNIHSKYCKNFQKKNILSNLIIKEHPINGLKYRS